MGGMATEWLATQQPWNLPGTYCYRYLPASKKSTLQHDFFFLRGMSLCACALGLGACGWGWVRVRWGWVRAVGVGCVRLGLPLPFYAASALAASLPSCVHLCCPCLHPYQTYRRYYHQIHHQKRTTMIKYLPRLRLMWSQSQPARPPPPPPPLFQPQFASLASAYFGTDMSSVQLSGCAREWAFGIVKEDEEDVWGDGKGRREK